MSHNWWCFIVAVLQVKYWGSEWKTKASKDVGKKENVCTLCEEFATDAQNYFSANKTQEEIVDMLQKSCSKLHSFKQEVSPFYFSKNLKDVCGTMFSFFIASARVFYGLKFIKKHIHLVLYSSAALIYTLICCFLLVVPHIGGLLCSSFLHGDLLCRA